MEIKSINTKIGQNQKTKELGCSSSTLHRYRNGINILSRYRIPPNIHKRRQNFSKTNLDDDSHCKNDLKRHQMTSNDLKRRRKIDLVKPNPNKDCAVNPTTDSKKQIELWIRA